MVEVTELKDHEKVLAEAMMSIIIFPDSKDDDEEVIDMHTQKGNIEIQDFKLLC